MCMIVMPSIVLLTLRFLGLQLESFVPSFVACKRAGVSKLLVQLVDVSAVDRQLALLWLRQCGGF